MMNRTADRASALLYIAAQISLCVFLMRGLALFFLLLLASCAHGIARHMFSGSWDNRGTLSQVTSNWSQL